MKPLIIATYFFGVNGPLVLAETNVFEGGIVICTCDDWVESVGTSDVGCTHTRRVTMGLGPETAVRFQIHEDFLLPTSPPSYSTTRVREAVVKTTTTDPKLWKDPGPGPKPKPVKLPPVGKRKFL